MKDEYSSDYPKYKTHLGVKYQKLTLKDHPKKGDILYGLPNSSDPSDLEPLKFTVTAWGAENHENHGKDDHYLIEVLQEYHPDFCKRIIARETENFGVIKKRLKMRELKKELAPRKQFLPLDRMYKLK